MPWTRETPRSARGILGVYLQRVIGGVTCGEKSEFAIARERESV